MNNAALILCLLADIGHISGSGITESEGMHMFSFS